MKRSSCIVIILLLCILLVGTIPTTVVSARNYLLKTYSSVNLTINQTGLILLDPFDQEKNITFTIQYDYGRFARPTGFPFTNRKLPTYIRISVIQQPEWCHVSIDKEDFEAPITTFLLKKNQTLYFSGNLSLQCYSTSAPALQESVVRLNVFAEPNGNIQTSSSIYGIPVAQTYFLYFETKWGSRVMSMEYGEEKNTTITVLNHGNTKTKFKIESTSLNNMVNITFDEQSDSNEFILDIDQEKEINISIQSHTDSKQRQEVTLQFKITSEAAENPSVQGLSQIQALFIELNPSSNKSDDLFFGNEQLIIQIGVNLIVLLIGILLGISWRKKTKTKSLRNKD